MKRMILIVLTVFFLTGFARADLLSERIGADKLRRALPQGASEILGDIDSVDETEFQSHTADILQRGIRTAGEGFSAALRVAARLLVITILCVIVQSLQLRFSGTAVTLAGTAAITACFATELHTMLSLGNETVGNISEFSKLLIPVMASAASLAGGFSASAAISSVTTVIMQLFVQILHVLFLPLIGVYVAVSAASAGLKEESMEGLSRFLSDLIKRGIRIILFIFTAYLSLTGILSESADAVAMRAAKLTMTAAVPVAGNILSEASASVIAGAKVLQNSIGVFGMLSVLSILLVPFLRLAMHYLTLQFTGLCCAAIGGTEQGRLIDRLSAAMGYLLAITGGCGLMVFISCVCFIRVQVV